MYSRRSLGLWPTLALVVIWTVRVAQALEPLEDRCSAIGAEPVRWPSAPINTCRLFLEHQGRQRFADVFFPAGYSNTSEAPLWLQLHGLFRPRWPQNASDVAALDRMNRAAEGQAAGWGVLTSGLRNKAVHVYPDATGSFGQPQFWNTGFWQCPAGRCMEEDVDDMGFLEALTQLLLERLPAKPPQVFLMGYSNGGMMSQALLCHSAFFRKTLSAVALVSTAVQRGYIPQACPYGQHVEAGGGTAGDAAAPAAVPLVFRSDKQVPVIFIQGMQDPLFPFYQGAQNGGSRMHSVLGMADSWSAKFGCASSSSSSSGGGGSGGGGGGQESAQAAPAAEQGSSTSSTTAATSAAAAPAPAPAPDPAPAPAPAAVSVAPTTTTTTTTTTSSSSSSGTGNNIRRLLHSRSRRPLAASSTVAGGVEPAAETTAAAGSSAPAPTSATAPAPASSESVVALATVTVTATTGSGPSSSAAERASASRVSNNDGSSSVPVPPLVHLAGPASNVHCRDFCLSYAGPDGYTDGVHQPLWLCAIPGGSHDWRKINAELAWRFFTQRTSFTTALPEPAGGGWPEILPTPEKALKAAGTATAAAAAATAGPAAVQPTPQHEAPAEAMPAAASMRLPSGYKPPAAASVQPAPAPAAVGVPQQLLSQPRTPAPAKAPAPAPAPANPPAAKPPPAKTGGSSSSGGGSSSSGSSSSGSSSSSSGGSSSSSSSSGGGTIVQSWSKSFLELGGQLNRPAGGVQAAFLLQSAAAAAAPEGGETFATPMPAPALAAPAPGGGFYGSASTGAAVATFAPAFSTFGSTAPAPAAASAPPPQLRPASAATAQVQLPGPAAPQQQQPVPMAGAEGAAHAVHAPVSAVPARGPVAAVPAPAAPGAGSPGGVAGSGSQAAAGPPSAAAAGPAAGPAAAPAAAPAQVAVASATAPAAAQGVAAAATLPAAVQGVAAAATSPAAAKVDVASAPAAAAAAPGVPPAAGSGTAVTFVPSGPSSSFTLKPASTTAAAAAAAPPSQRASTWTPTWLPLQLPAPSAAGSSGSSSANAATANLRQGAAAGVPVLPKPLAPGSSGAKAAPVVPIALASPGQRGTVAARNATAAAGTFGPTFAVAAKPPPPQQQQGHATRVGSQRGSQQWRVAGQGKLGGKPQAAAHQPQLQASG